MFMSLVGVDIPITIMRLLIAPELIWENCGLTP